MMKLTIRARLVAMIGGLSVVLLGIGAAGIAGMNNIQNRLEHVFEDNVVPMEQLAAISALMAENVRQLQLGGMHDPRLPEHVLHNHPVTMHHGKVEQNIAEITRLWGAYTARGLDGEEARLANAFTVERTAFVKDGLLKTLELQGEGKFAEANMHLVRNVGPSFNQAYGSAKALLEMKRVDAQADHLASDTAYARLRWVVGGVILAGVGVAALFGWLLIRAITWPLGEAVRVAEAVAEGDFTARVAQMRDDEIGKLMQAQARMVQRLGDAIGRIRSSADAVGTASEQIAQGNQDLSSRTEQQASALQQTAATMDELGSTVRNNADSARQASQLAQSASAVADQGGAVVEQVVASMKGINDSSKKIADIIGTIDGIAFQTNILALNAAVEAARAGEQGRGFAVVASEVRSLAQRSAQAAREIKQLISASVVAVEQGTAHADRAGATMQEVVVAARRVTEIVAEISAASTEQSSGVNQVGQAVTQMDHATQQNAALVEQSAAAAESLRQQAQQLVQVVAQFRLAHEAGGGHGAS